MNKEKLHPQKSFTFLDIDTFARERFTSGVLIRIKEVILNLLNAGVDAKIVSIAHINRVLDTHERDLKVGKNCFSIDGIPVVEYLFNETAEENPTLYTHAMRESLLNNNEVILLTSPAVNLREINLLVFEESLKLSKKVTVMVPDALYPTFKTHNKDDVIRFNTFLEKTTVLTSSKFLVSKLMKDTGVNAKVMPSLFNPGKIISDGYPRDYITLINHHPIKGRAIFDSIAKKMPHEKFLIVENWTDTPLYTPSSENIKFEKFSQDVREIYKKTKILLVPSLIEESFGRVVIEAMLNGIPVIAHNIGGIPEAGMGIITLIEPPKTSGPVINPIIDSETLDTHSDKFVKVIKDLLSNEKDLESYSETLRKKSLEYCKNSKLQFDHLMNDIFK